MNIDSKDHNPLLKCVALFIRCSLSSEKWRGTSLGQINKGPSEGEKSLTTLWLINMVYLFSYFFVNFEKYVYQENIPVGVTD